MTGPVRGRRDHRFAETRENVAGNLMVWDTDRDGIETGRREFGHSAPGGFGQDHGEGPRPERFGEPQRLGIEPAQSLCCFQIHHVGNERIECRTSLSLVKPRNRTAIGGVRAKPVNGLRRERHQAAGGEQALRLLDGRGAGLQHGCLQRDCHRIPTVLR